MAFTVLPVLRSYRTYSYLFFKSQAMREKLESKKHKRTKTEEPDLVWVHIYTTVYSPQTICYSNFFKLRHFPSSPLSLRAVLSFQHYFKTFWGLGIFLFVFQFEEYY